MIVALTTCAPSEGSIGMALTFLRSLQGVAVAEKDQDMLLLSVESRCTNICKLLFDVVPYYFMLQVEDSLSI